MCVRTYTSGRGCGEHASKAGQAWRATPCVRTGGASRPRRRCCMLHAAGRGTVVSLLLRLLCRVRHGHCPAAALCCTLDTGRHGPPMPGMTHDACCVLFVRGEFSSPQQHRRPRTCMHMHVHGLAAAPAAASACCRPHIVSRHTHPAPPRRSPPPPPPPPAGRSGDLQPQPAGAPIAIAPAPAAAQPTPTAGSARTQDRCVASAQRSASARSPCSPWMMTHPDPHTPHVPSSASWQP